MRRRHLIALLPVGAAAAATAACTPRVIPMGPPIAEPAFARDALVMADGARLPLHVWLPEGPPRAAMIALHGFNEYGRSFMEDPAPQFTAQGIAVYAYDQRGFGRAPHPGIWAGARTLAADATAAARLIRERHPGLPLFMMGESMGGAVLMVAAGSDDPPPVDGLILLAPAVWGRDSMPRLARWLLDAAAVTVPALGFRNGVGGITPTDNEAALRKWSRDPLVRKETRVDTAIGLVDLMDAAVAAAPRLGLRAAGQPAPPRLLLLYGGHDQLVPDGPTLAMLQALPDGGRNRMGFYKEGYHQLLRDRDGAKVVADILAWIAEPTLPLPSGAEQAARVWLRGS